MKKLAIIGASGHGKVVADIAVLNGYDEIVFLDDDENVKNCGKYSVIGKSSFAKVLAKEGYHIFIGIGNAITRQRMFNDLKDNALLVSLVHPSATISSEALLGPGSVVMAGAVVNPDARIGAACIVNTCASVDHDCVISDFVHVSVGTHIAGSTTIGERTWVGAGAVVSNNISICSDCMIGTGTVVVKNIDAAGTYVGNPARKIK